MERAVPVPVLGAGERFVATDKLVNVQAATVVLSMTRSSICSMAKTAALAIAFLADR